MNSRTVLSLHRASQQSLWLLLLVAPTLVHAVTSPRNTHEVSMWIQSYYKEPSPKSAASALEVLLNDSDLMAKSIRLDPMVHFFAVLAHRNKALKTQIKNLSRTAATNEQKDFLLRIDKRAENPIAPIPRDPNDLDVLWSDFFATGRVDPLEKIVSVLQYREQDVDLQSLVWRIEKITSKTEALRLLRAAAAWSLSTNAKAHPRVREFLEKQLKATSGPSQRQIKEILEGRINVK